MKEIDKEILSRILDEDVSEFEIQRILKEMKSNGELRLKLHRYNLIGYVMRNEIPEQVNQNFVTNVMNNLVDEKITISEVNETIEQVEGANDKARFKTAIGLAIAASVAVVSFVSFQNYMQTDNEMVPPAVVAERVVEESDIQRVSSEDLQNFISNPKAAESFNSYIMNHAEYASPRVSVPHVRIVGYGKDELNTDN